MRLRRALVAFSFLLAFESEAATRTWDGSSSANWGTAANWMENAIPAAGDDLVFPAGAMNLAMSNNIMAGTAFNSLTFQAGGYSITTNQFALNAGITDNDTSGTNTINVSIAVLATQSFVTATGGTLTVSGTIGMAAGVTLIVDGGGSTNLTGVVGPAAGSLTKSGSGTLTLSNANTYGGATAVNQGVVLVTNAAALGTAAGATTVASGAALQISGGITCAEPLVVNGYGLSALTGAVRTLSGTNTWTGTINFATSGSFGVDNGAQLTVNGVVSGGDLANIAKYGTGLLVFAGANTYTGGTGVETGTLRAQNSSSLGGAAGIGTIVDTGTLEVQGGVVLAENLSFNSNPIATGNLRNISGVNVITGAGDFNSPTVIGVDAGSLSLTGFFAGASGFTKVGPEILILSGASVYSGDTTVSAGTLQIRNGSSLGSVAAGTTVASGAALEIQGSMAVGTETLTLAGTGVTANGALRNVSGTSSWAGPIMMTAATTANISAGQLTLSGPVSGTGALTKAGPGTLVLSTANTYSGGTLVTSGTLIVNGSLPAADTVTVSPGATLGGSGSVGPVVNNGGTISPGQGAPGLLSTGPVSFGSMSTFKVEIGGANPGAGYDQLAVNGTVQLGTVTLSPSIFGAFAPPPGSTYTIIANDGADAVTGTFLGQAEGSFVTVSGYRFQISYVGGDGNDVVLTRVATTRTWTGAVSTAWTVAGNWMGAVAPVAGDDLVFPAGAMNLANSNDFPVGFAVNSITISASGYTL
ncbi:MAG TPA: autotransporter-associated beta strand repeat-containing protein, partial [Thermoanaerobaculia bacterium]|nr:autotransporter-associated beta strand repeat-containing protein [Thermoanaerobaculia bacterium]